MPTNMYPTGSINLYQEEYNFGPAIEADRVEYVNSLISSGLLSINRLQYMVDLINVKVTKKVNHLPEWF